MKKYFLIFGLYFVFSLVAITEAMAETAVRFHTSLGDIDVMLDPTNAPLTVSNFLGYVNRGDYNNSIFHRSLPSFIIQGGGYYVSNGTIQSITAQTAVANEYKNPNVRGTIAMAKVAGEPNSATDEWFFNTIDNTSTLGASNNGGCTVFGNILNSQGLAVMDAIAALPVENAGTPFDQLPVIDYTSGTVAVSNLVYVNAVTVQPAPDFFNGEVALNDGIYYLSFTNGNFFGYYSYLSDPNYIYHFDLGYEYVFAANDNHSGIYLYDFKSDTFFYTSPSFPFPYLYDFTLHTTLYYYPDPSNAGHYNTDGVRYFYNFNTGQIITK